MTCHLLPGEKAGMRASNPFRPLSSVALAKAEAAPTSSTAGATSSVLLINRPNPSLFHQNIGASATLLAQSQRDCAPKPGVAK
jgi:hypothetical protein